MILAELLNNSLIPGDQPIRGLTLDSRQVRPGDVFLALEGTQTHGQRFIDSAIQQGALAVLKDAPTVTVETLANGVPCIAVPHLSAQIGFLAARFYGHPSRDLHIVGVTGTNGKTSISHFIAQILHTQSPCGLIGTLGYGLYGQLQTASHTTPDAIRLQTLFAQFREQNVRQVAMEVSSHALVQGRINGIEFDCAVFTNLTHDHLDYHQTMEAYGAAKKLLFQVPGLKTAVINVDDDFGKQILATLPSTVKPLTYSLTQPTVDVYAQIRGMTVNGCILQIKSAWGQADCQSPLLGEFNISNELAALTALLDYGLPFSQVIELLTTLCPVRGRMERFGHAKSPTVVVDYAHTPDALQKVLIALRNHCTGQLWCVFGCGGNRDRGKRSVMGQIAQYYADKVVITDDNPRYEDPQAIVADILQGYPSPTAIIRDRAHAIRYALQQAHIGDIVLVAGKGHEDYQIVGDQRLAFSDRDWVRSSLDLFFKE